MTFQAFPKTRLAIARSTRSVAALTTCAALLAGSLVMAVSPAAAQTATAGKTLRYVPNGDLKILDPLFTTAYITRNFGYMVYDTLYAQDAKGQPKPQMVASHTVSKDGREWSFTLRPGLKFSDGAAVTSADVVASLARWTARDSIGRAMTAAGAEWKATTPATFTLTLKEPFGLVIDALAKPSGYPPIIMPERLAKSPQTGPLSEVMGSGPFTFKRDEWVPGSKVVFLKNPNYVGRSEPPSGLSGNKTAKLDRVEWVYLPDANSATAALKNGEVDMLESVPADYITPLRGDPNVKIGSGGSYQGFIVFNQTQPPFNNEKARQAVAHAVNQEKFMAGMGFPLDMRMKHCATFFICGSANDTSAGAEPFRTVDVAKGKALLAEAGYKNEKVVVLVPTDIAYLNAAALITVQTLKSIGMNVDAQAMDWSSITARRSKKDSPEAGGWNVYVTVAGEFDVNSPVTNAYLSPSCGNSLPGWPCDKQLDEIRSAWIRETAPAKRRELLDAFQTRAYQAFPYVNYGQYSPAFAARSSLKNVDLVWNGIATLWVLDK